MRHFIRRYIGRTNFLVAFIVVVVIYYNEVYLYRSGKLKKVECENKSKCVRILLVADPQLIGLHNEILHFLTPLTILDSDRYLAKTYSIAYEHAKPDIVIFLGDLLDEGSSASDVEFSYYMDRFFNIFNLSDDPSVLNKYIFLSGDNDIGGEGGERVTRNNVYRFERKFMQQDVVKYKNMTFFKVNRLTRSVPIVENADFYNTESGIRIALSHMPLMFQPSSFVEKVLKQVQPHLLFTAHIHKSMIISTDALIQKDRQIVPIMQDDNKVYDYPLGESDMYEIIVPTSSYRMGTNCIGFGLGVIENDHIQYTVLWSPSRFDQLVNYLLLFVVLLFASCFCLCMKCRLRRMASYSSLNNNKAVVIID